MTATNELATGRAMDELIATKVMGLPVRTLNDRCPNCGSEMRFCGERSWCFGGCGWVYSPYKEYSTDVAADHEVLVRVREQWPLYLTVQFTRACEATWEKRGVTGFGAWLIYQPGDYSRAALAALGVAATEVRHA